MYKTLTLLALLGLVATAAGVKLRAASELPPANVTELVAQVHTHAIYYHHDAERNVSCWITVTLHPVKDATEERQWYSEAQGTEMLYGVGDAIAMWCRAGR
jgi:hypothetical protein